MFASIKTFSQHCCFGFSILLGGCASHATTIQTLDHKAQRLGHVPSPYAIVVDTRQQTLSLYDSGRMLQKVYRISSSRKGLGEEWASFKTPRGLHRIREKLGHGVPEQGVFHQRQFTGWVWAQVPRHLHRKDYISTRILRLEGLHTGLNRGLNKRGKLVDSHERAIYIHGTTMEWKLGKPFTKGCIHMGARDIVQLFDMVPEGTMVWIL